MHDIFSKDEILPTPCGQYIIPTIALVENRSQLISINKDSKSRSEENDKSSKTVNKILFLT